jgi:hypothetical protein
VLYPAHSGECDESLCVQNAITTLELQLRLRKQLSVYKKCQFKVSAKTTMGHGAMISAENTLIRSQGLDVLYLENNKRRDFDTLNW